MTITVDIHNFCEIVFCFWITRKKEKEEIPKSLATADSGMGVDRYEKVCMCVGGKNILMKVVFFLSQYLQYFNNAKLYFMQAKETHEKV